MKTQAVREDDLCVDQDVESWIKLIESLLQEHKYVKAEDCIRFALSMKPNCEKLWLELGNLLLGLNQFSEAEKCYEKAVKINPENEEALKYLNLLVTNQR